MSGLTRAQREQLIESVTRALVWEYAGYDIQVRERNKAIRLVAEMERGMNVGNAIQIRRSIKRVIERETVA